MLKKLLFIACALLLGAVGPAIAERSKGGGAPVANQHLVPSHIVSPHAASAQRAEQREIDGLKAQQLASLATVLQAAFSLAAFIGLLVTIHYARKTWLEAAKTTKIAREQLDDFERPHVLLTAVELPFKILANKEGVSELVTGANLKLEIFGRAPCIVRELWIETYNQHLRTNLVMVAASCALGRVIKPDNEFVTGDLLEIRWPINSQFEKNYLSKFHEVSRRIEGIVYYEHIATSQRYLRRFSFQLMPGDKIKRSHDTRDNAEVRVDEQTPPPYRVLQRMLDERWGEQRLRAVGPVWTKT